MLRLPLIPRSFKKRKQGPLCFNRSTDWNYENVVMYLAPALDGTLEPSVRVSGLNVSKSRGLDKAVHRPEFVSQEVQHPTKTD